MENEFYSENPQLPDTSFLDYAYYTQRSLSRAEYQEYEAAHVSLDQMLFQHVNLNKTLFKKVQVLDSRFSVCDLANAQWTEASMSRVGTDRLPSDWLAMW
ncbi:hypothetical protein KSB_67650 [Ktedonobacter robiniae]|uniref:Uncharacterized protein n=1 Tax=Ktedonobacter robiniae TaxID=2778365 RepID=A0ABQ3V027_9CHLR|nr:hypothetical protein KSB_67650 [Ktedonobacter robiniae]